MCPIEADIESTSQMCQDDCLKRVRPQVANIGLRQVAHTPHQDVLAALTEILGEAESAVAGASDVS